MRTKVTLEKRVTRGPESWAYIYIALGFVVAIEGTTIQMITPLKFPWNLITYIALGGATYCLFRCSGWFQNKLIGWKMKYESKARKVA